MSLARLGHRFRRNAILAIGSGILLLFLGIALPRERRQALLRGGTALAGVALVLFFLPPLARTALTLSMKHAELRPVAAGVWDAFAGGLRLWALVLAGVGVVLASAASSFASHVEIEQVARRVWDRLQKPARTWQGEIVRAVLLTGVGLLAAFRPTATLQGLMVDRRRPARLRGAARALHARAPAPPGGRAARRGGPRRGAREGGPVGGPAGPRARTCSSASSCVGLIAAAVLFLRSPEALPATPALTDACNGDRALCDRRLDEVVFPGAHNSMSGAEFAGWMFPNQELGSVSVLGHGIRALLFDVHYGTPIGGRVKTDIQDEAGLARQVREGRRQGGGGRRDAHPRPPHRPAHRPPRRLPLPRLLRARGRAARDDARGRARLPRPEPGRGPRLRDRGLRDAGRRRGGVPGERARALRVPGRRASRPSRRCGR